MLGSSFLIQVQRWYSKQIDMIPGKVLAKEKLLRESRSSLESILEDREMEMVF